MGPSSCWHDLTSLRLRQCRQPINPEAWVWYREHIGGDRTPVRHVGTEMG
jgi:acyl-coenzyme A synthetase/AMP-(fatty) acid ligase